MASIERLEDGGLAYWYRGADMVPCERAEARCARIDYAACSLWLAITLKVLHEADAEAERAEDEASPLLGEVRFL
jgi:hypothetical protein